MHGLTGGQLKYGPVMGSDNPGYPCTIVTSQQFRNAGGKFVFMASGLATICVASSQTIFGWADCEDFLSTTGDIRSIITNGATIFRLPINAGTFVVATHVGNAYDLTQVTNGAGVTLCQGVDLTATTRLLVIVVGGDLANNEWVDVIMNPAKRV